MRGFAPALRTLASDGDRVGEDRGAWARFSGTPGCGGRRGALLLTRCLASDGPAEEVLRARFAQVSRHLGLGEGLDFSPALDRSSFAIDAARGKVQYPAPSETRSADGLVGEWVHHLATGRHGAPGLMGGSFARHLLWSVIDGLRSDAELLAAHPQLDPLVARAQLEAGARLEESDLRVAQYLAAIRRLHAGEPLPPSAPAWLTRATEATWPAVERAIAPRLEGSGEKERDSEREREAALECLHVVTHEILPTYVDLEVADGHAHAQAHVFAELGALLVDERERSLPCLIGRPPEKARKGQPNEGGNASSSGKAGKAKSSRKKASEAKEPGEQASEGEGSGESAKKPRKQGQKTSRSRPSGSKTAPSRNRANGEGGGAGPAGQGRVGSGSGSGSEDGSGVGGGAGGASGTEATSNAGDLDRDEALESQEGETGPEDAHAEAGAQPPLEPENPLPDPNPADASPSPDASDSGDSPAPGSTRAPSPGESESSPRMDERSRGEVSSALGEYLALKAADRPVIEALKRSLLAVFPERRLEYEGYYRSGGRLDPILAVQHRLEYLETGHYDPKHYKRLVPSGAPKASVVLCLDLSRSMSFPDPGTGEARVVHLRRAAVVFLEALKDLSIDHAVVGYSDNAQVLKGWDRMKDDEARARLLSALNPDQSTNDLAALEAAMALLSTQRTPQNLIVFITDAHEASAKSYVDALGEIGTTGRARVIGLGVGDARENINDTYREGVAVEDITALPLKLGQVLRHGLQRPAG